MITVCPCHHGKDGWSTDATRLIQTQFDESHYTGEKDLLRTAQIFAKGGVAVTVRPMFNDLLNERGEVIGFREWRSFGGSLLEQVDFPEFKYRVKGELVSIPFRQP